MKINIVQKVLQNGMTHVQTSSEEKKYKVLNLMAFLSVMTTLLFSLIEIAISPDKERHIPVHLIALVLTIGVIYLQSKGKLYIACGLFLFTILTHALVFAFILKPESQLEYFLLVIPAFSLIFFDDKRVTVFILVLCILCFLIPQYFQPYFSIGKQAFVAKTLLFIFVYILVNYFKKLNTTNEIKLANKISELEKIKDFQNQFFLNVAHEIRTPLTIIGGYNRKLMKELTEGTNSFNNTKSINEEVQRVNQMVDDVMLLSKMGNENNITLSPLLLNEVINKLIVSFQPLYEEKEIQLIYKKGQAIHISANRNYLERIIGNLLMNAMKYTSAGGTVQVKTEENTQAVKLHIIDSGIGISKEDCTLIFNRFYQVKNSTNYAGGSGIGLAFSKEVVGKMNGSIDVQSELGKGSTFTIEFPIFTPTQNIAPSEDSSEEILSPLPSSKNSSSETKKETILLVEDNLKMREYLKDMLSAYTIVESKNGEEAWEYLKLNVPDLIITDHMMPGMNGEELVNNIRNTQFKDFSETAIIVLTAVSEQEQKLNYLQLGVDDYVRKPFHEEELLARIRYSLLRIAERKKAMKDAFEIDVEIPLDKLKGEDNKPRIIQEIAAYIDQECSNYQFGIQTILDKFNLTNSTLYRKVKLHAGLSPNQWITEIRLQKARRILLEDGEITKKQLVADIGMKNISHFKALYKERFGVSI